MAVILVVDDEFGVAELLQAVLEDEGHRVLTAIHGRAALERIAQDRPDLILTDYMMPVMDGAALIAALQANPRLSGIPVALMSSLPQESIAEAVGGVPFLRKPFRIADVLAIVSEALPRT